MNEPIASSQVKSGHFRQPGVDYLLASGLAFLCAFTDLKFGPIQLTEFVTVVAVICLGPIMLFERRANSGIGTTNTRWLAGFFLISVLSSAIALYRGGFAVPLGAEGILKQPGWINLSRVFQFALAVFALHVVLRVQIGSRILIRANLIARAYLASALLSAIYGIVSWPLMRVGVDIGSAYGEDGLRIRGFFVEGGPFGLYLVSALMVLVAMRSKGGIGRTGFWFSLFVLLIALAMAQSKSAVAAGLLALILVVPFSSTFSVGKFLRLIVLACIVLVPISIVSNFNNVWERVYERRSELLDAPEQFSSDTNVVAGRISGSVIVPEMIAENPLLGVGLGNYSLLRNSSQYLGILPAVDVWDLHGLGLLGFAAEVGILGVSCFVFYFGSIIWRIRRMGANFSVVALGIFPVVAFIFGVQPTFLYPWIIAGIALLYAREQAYESLQ